MHLFACADSALICNPIMHSHLKGQLSESCLFARFVQHFCLGAFVLDFACFLLTFFLFCIWRDEFWEILVLRILFLVPCILRNSVDFLSF